MKTRLFLLTLALSSNLLANAQQTIPVEETSVPSAVKAPKTFRHLPQLKGTAQENTFFEGFEQWPGGKGWLPEGWKDESKVGHTDPVGYYDQDLTWQITNSQTSMMPVYEGKASAYIQVSNYYSNTPFEMQDEWLITPAITVKEQDYLFFYLLYSPAYTCYNREADNFTAENSHLEVHVSENGTDWLPLWNLLDEVKKMPESELRENLYSDVEVYTPFYIDLKEWSNKTVHLAFRYVGQNGNSMSLDNVAVGLPVPTTYYLSPLSAMYVGLSPEVTSPKSPYMVLPPYVENIWENVSMNYNKIKWTYYDNNNQIQESNEEKLVTPPYDPSFVESPSIQAFFNASASDVYQNDYKQMQIGGSAFGYEDAEGKKFDFYGLSNYNCMDPNVEVKFNRTIGFDENSVDKWCGLLGVTPYDFEVRAVANLFGTPASPYVLRNGYLSMFVQKLRSDAVLTMTVRSVDAEGIPAQILTEATCPASDIHIPSPEAYTYAYFQFPEPIVIDGPVLVEVTGFDTTQDQVYIPALFTNTMSNVASAFISLITEFGPSYFPLSALNGFTNNAHVAGIAMSVGAEYPWLEGNGETKVIDAPTEGLTQEIVLSTSTRLEDLVIKSDAEWVTTTAVEYDLIARQSHLNLVVAENTEATDRKATITLSTIGVEKPITYTVTQAKSPTSIQQTEQEGTIIVDENQLVVCGFHQENVTIFDASGAKVGVYALDSSTTIDISSWNEGVYVLLFDNGKTYKIAK